MVHHGIIGSFALYGLLNPVSSISLIGKPIVYSELSTIFLNISLMLYFHKKNHTLAFKINGIILLIMFFIFRILTFPYIIFCWYSAGHYIPVICFAFTYRNAPFFRCSHHKHFARCSAGLSQFIITTRN